ncbi:MAG: hypothetical protein JXP73_14595 [Deltaproteobacteria bacterium]|nr:hypothetical protein [Deltaproteobacteria bacterium]
MVQAAACAVAVLSTAWPVRAEERLLVVVETGSGAAVSAEEARAAIGAEVDAAVVGPGSLRPESLVGTLIVEIDERSAVLRYQPGEGTARVRQIELPQRHDERLKTIAWIALNLIKDQVGEPSATDDQPPSSAAGAPDAAPLPVIEPPPAAAPQPPTAVQAATASPPAKPFSDTPVVSQAVQKDGKQRSPWSLALFGGPTLHPLSNSIEWEWDPSSSGNEWQIEATRSMGDWAAGVALDLGEQDIPAAGVAAYVGDGWHWRKLRLEGTVGAGLELTQRPVTTVRQSIDSSTGYKSTVDVSGALRPRAYGRANATLAWRAWRALDLMLRVALHLEPDDRMYSYGTALLGLGLDLP